MSIKPRSPGQTAISISLPAELVDEIDGRAKALGMSRSQYLVQLARADLVDRGALTLRELPSSNPDVQKAEAAAIEVAKAEAAFYSKKRRKTAK